MSDHNTTGADLWRVLDAMNEASGRLKEHLADLETGKAPPTDAEARKQLIASDIRWLRKLGEEFDEAAHELYKKYQESKNN